ncbi:Ankyrin-2 [Geodia barretti]|uniref:Ankyrin-2 n=1 Tax=Geodia barretti TaxID=519541 RepID=A0AA35TT91_GEOBA|nr:Ankyrin-2 [Geodia barretti]
MAASQEGHVEVVDQLLQHGATVDLQRSDGWSSLMAASDNGHVGVVDKLIQHGATVDLHDKDGVSSLMVASEYGPVEVVDQLLQHGATVDLQRSNTGYTALMFACKGGHLDTVKVLMEHGADPLIRSLAGVTALGVASTNEFPDVCNELNQPDRTTDVEYPETSTEKEEVVEGKKVPKGDYKRYLKIRALRATLWRTGKRKVKRKVKAAIETLYSNLN